LYFKIGICGEHLLLRKSLAEHISAELNTYRRLI
jgi:hypothetical protein